MIYKTRSRILAAVLALAMIFPILPTVTLQAEEAQEYVDLSQPIEFVGENQDNITEGEALQDNQEIIVIQDTQEANQDTQEMNPALAYLYVERPVVMAGEKQVIVAEWNAPAESMSIVVENVATAKQEELVAVLAEDNTYVFEMEFSGQSVRAYQITEARVTNNGTKVTYPLSEMGIQAFFGVNEEYVTDEKSDVLVMDALTFEADEVEMNMVSFAGDEQASDIREVIEQSLEDATSDMPGIVGTGATTFSGERNIVVVLDAGHDSTHRGASRENLREDELVLEIAKYCKAELETYGGVKVYMTRTTGNCPFPGTTSQVCIQRRVEWAKTMGADVFVSLHLNSSESSGAAGAEVFYPKDNAQGEALARRIQERLVALGLSNRGVKPDEGYIVVKHSKANGFPGLIVEHAFMSNANDVNQHLRTPEGLRRLGVADATGIATHYGLRRGEWEKDGSNWKWKYPNGTYATSRWLWIAEGNFYFDANGIMKTGWITAGGNKYYADASGYMQTGWVRVDGTYYLMNRDGQMQTGWQKVYDDWYYLASDGKMQTGWLTLGTRRYYLNGSGHMLIGTHTIDGQRYTFNGDGILQAEQRRGWNLEAGTWYYYLNNGTRATGWQKVYDDWYYLASDGKMQTGWLTLGSRQYYLNSSGQMLTGTHRINGEICAFNSDGILITRGTQNRGWIEIEGTYYFCLDNGGVATGWRKVYDDWYYLRADGRMHTGWLNLGNERYYFNTSGQRVTGMQTIDGSQYIFDANGILGKHTSIEGATQTTIAQMVRYYNRHATYPAFYANSDARTIEAFCQIFYEEATMQNIRAEVAFAQSMLETGFLRFGGDVKREQYNFGGIGATGGGAAGASFNTVREGVRAQIHHLQAYASTAGEAGLVMRPTMSPRYHLVTKGSAPYVEWLGIQENPSGAGWATGAGYGERVVNIMRALLAS